MLKIFVTGDNHIGLKYSSHPQASVLVRSRITAFEQMVEKANEEECGLFIITGDLFENTYSISKKEIQNILGILSGFKGTVAVLPGNHDFYDNDVKVWQCFEDVMKGYDNILLLKEFHTYALTVENEDVVLYPALCTSMHSEPGQNNLGWIKEENIVPDSVYRIGVAHGAVEGETIDNEGFYFLMKRSELEEIPVDVWLIGHTHVPFPKNLTDEFSVCEKILNAGTHVQTDVSCNTEGLCFIVEIDENKTVKAKKYVSGNIHFYRKTIEVSMDNMEQTLHRELDALEDNSVVDLIICGAVSSYEYENRNEIIESVLSRFVEGKYNDYALSKQITKELIESEFPETSFSAGLLCNLMDDPKEAQLAYELLKSLKEGK